MKIKPLIYLLVGAFILGGVYLVYTKNKPIVSADTTVEGDVYTQNQNKVGNLKIGGNSLLITSDDNIRLQTGDGVQTISGYEAGSKLSYSDIVTQMNSNAERLLKESAKKYGQNQLSGEYNINPNNKPEGQVWVVENGNLTINDCTIVGRGTFIIRNGNLLINGDINLGQNGSLGFMVLGVNKNIVISKGVQTLNGLYYAPNGKIEVVQ